MDIVRKIFVGGIVAIGLSATAAVPALAQEDGVIRIGVTVRMIDEEGSAIGHLLTDEFDAINKAGGINGKKIDVTLLNDECKADVGVSNALKLINDKKVDILIGSTCSSVSLPIVDITAKAGVPMVTPSSTAAAMTLKKSAWVFRMSVSERFYNAVVGKYVGDQVGKKVAYIWTSDAASQSFATNMIKFMKDTYKVDPVFSVQANQADVDYRAYLLKIKAAQPDALSVAGTAQEMARMLAQANEVGIPASVKRVGSSNAGVPTMPRLGGDNVNGLIFSAAFSAFDTRPIARKFIEMTTSRYKVALPSHDFSQVWDTVQIIKQALTKAKLKLTADSLAADRTAIRDALAATTDYQGLASGPISFCAAPTPECRDGNRTAILIEYVKGGTDFSQKVLTHVTFAPDFGL